MIGKWIAQLDDWDQSSAFFAFQSLEREVFRASRPGNSEACGELAMQLAEALTATPQLSARARGQLARLLGYVPHDGTVSYLARAMEDLEVREMARYALETNASPAAEDALLKALDAAGSTFRVGIVNSLSRRRGPRVLTALRKAAADPQLEVRQAALLALADLRDPEAEALFEKAGKSPFEEERRTAEIARARRPG
jgi:HEAT repeat protein